MINRPADSSIVFHNVISAIDEINLTQDGHSGGQGMSQAATGASSQVESSASAKPLSQLDQSKLRERGGQ